MPVLSDEALVGRVFELHRALESHHLSKRELKLTDARFNLSRSWRTVSLVEGKLQTGDTVTVITTNDSTYYRYMVENPDAFLKPGEVLGSRPTYVYGEGRSRLRIHAEQLGTNDAKGMGATSGRVASSNVGCDDLCVSTLREEFPTFRHLNPEKPGTQPPSIPSNATSSARAVSNESRGVSLERLARRATSQASRGVADAFGESAAPRAAARTAASEVGQEAVASGRVFVSSERTALKSLVYVAQQFELLANAILVAGAIIEIVILYFKIQQEVKRQRAIEGAIQTKMGAWVRVLLIHEGEQLAKVFLRKWNRPSELFLYASPLLEIRTQNGTDYQVEFSTAGTLLERAVSREPLEGEEEELAADYWQFRFSIPYPIFTPFDAYLAYVEVLGEYLAASWGSAIRRKKVDSATTRRLVDAAMDLATVAALLKTDEAAGFEDTGFNAETAVVDRQRTIRRIERLVEKKLSPALRHLEKLGILDPAIVVVRGVSSGIHGRMREVLSAEDRLSRYVDILAADLSSIPAKALRYQRRDKLAPADRIAAETLAYKDEFFAQFTDGVIEFMPKERRPVPEVRQGTPAGDILLVPPQ